MINFTVGPVQSFDVVKEIGARDIPYFRTSEFSSVLLENENLMKKFVNATEDSRALFITGSGTAAMEAAVINFFTTNDKVLVVNGGSFGQRFVDICRIHEIPCDEIKIEAGKALDASMLIPFENNGYTGFLVNIHETSTGVLYDQELITNFCRRNKLFLLVDAISSFLADKIDMESLEAGALITGSQKALACPPGVSIIVISAEGVEKIKKNNVKSLYFDLRLALKDAERGQTPFTPAVGILLQINERLKQIERNGGVITEQNRISELAKDFRVKISNLNLPLDIASESMSNAVTPLRTRNCSARDIFNILKNEYGIWVCPNGGGLQNEIFRVGHLGNLTIEDNQKLLESLKDLVKRGILI